MIEWVDILKEPLPTDVKHPLFAETWPLYWVFREGAVEAEMAIWAPAIEWKGGTKDDPERRFVRDHWQFSEYPGSDDFGDSEVKDVRWYQKVYVPEPPQV